ncbi:hypothetical protein FB451DRAFT_1562992 [Mycena latifolia]|nr:hypothetical protein FB451DRAFT_1562992 [Mycena latifolia]
MDASPSQGPAEPPADPLSAPADPPDAETKQKAQWTFSDEDVLLVHLDKNKASADGAGFKMTIFNAAVTPVNKNLTRGGLKTAKSCQGKFTQLKRTFRVIQDIQKQSGFHWDNDTGASIDVASASAWGAYIKRAPEAKPFRNSGWGHLSRMEQLMPATAKGTHVFRPGAVEDGGDALGGANGGDDSQEEVDDEDHAAIPGARRRREARSSSPPWVLGPDDALPSGDNDSERESSPAPETPFPSKRKRPATATPHYQKKQPRLSGGARALENIATSAADFNEIFAGVGNGLTAAVAAAAAAPAAPAGASAPIAPPAAQLAFQTTPHRKQDAIKRAQRLEKWLGLDNLVLFVELLRQDVSLVDTYNALEDDDLRVGWVKDQVNKNTAFDLNAYDFSSM